MSDFKLEAPASNGKSSTELLARVSASRLGTFHQCRLKFYFRYVEALQRPKSPGLHLGSAVHFVLQWWNRARWKGEPIDGERLHELFLAFWSVEQCKTPVSWGDESETELRDSAWALARMYFEKTPIPRDEKPEAVEVAVEADLSAHGLPTLVGFIDLVRAGGKIVDFKTTGQTPSADRVIHLHELQLSCYGLLYRDATGNREGGFELHHLVKLKTPKLVAELPEQSIVLLRDFHLFLTGDPNPVLVGQIKDFPKFTKGCTGPAGRIYGNSQARRFGCTGTSLRTRVFALAALISMCPSSRWTSDQSIRLSSSGRTPAKPPSAKDGTSSGFADFSSVAKLIENAAPVELPMTLIKAYCPIRAKEAGLASWESINWDTRTLTVWADEAKTREERAIHLPAELCQRLRPLARTGGKIYPYKSFYKVGPRLAKKAGLKWIRNGWRKTTISHLQAAINDLHRVAEEAGTSVAKIKTKLSKAALAARWPGLLRLAKG